MFTSHMFETIDTHTAGNPTRNVVAGVPTINGNTMAEKLADLRERLDWVRSVVMLEPRGHSNMSGTIWVPPCNPEAHMGILFIDAGGHMPMCGHSTIGSVTAMLESGKVPMEDGPITKVNIDTPAGLVRTEATIENGRVKRVAFRGVPSFLFKSGTVEVPGYGRVPYDVAYGGNTYALTDAKWFNLNLRSGHLAAIEKAAQEFGAAVRAAVPFQHPEQPFINVITHVMFYTAPDDPKATFRNTVIFLPNSTDRSPCGTGTSARVASLFAKGELGLNEEFVHESVIGTQFTARIIEPVTVGGCKGGIPVVAGRAHITGLHTFVIDPEDALRFGFRLD